MRTKAHLFKKGKNPIA